MSSESGGAKTNSEDWFWLLLLSNPFAVFTKNNNMFHVKIMAQGFQLLHLLHCESAVGKILILQIIKVFCLCPASCCAWGLNGWNGKERIGGGQGYHFWKRSRLLNVWFGVCTKIDSNISQEVVFGDSAIPNPVHCESSFCSVFSGNVRSDTVCNNPLLPYLEGPKFGCSPSL